MMKNDKVGKWKMEDVWNEDLVIQALILMLEASKIKWKLECSFWSYSQQKSVSGWENSSFQVKTRVSCFATMICSSGMRKLEFRTQNSSLGVKTWVNQLKTRVCSVFNISSISGLVKLEFWAVISYSAPLCFTFSTGDVW